jgi:hypothetical protein
MTAVQAVIDRWRELMEEFAHYSDEMIMGLGQSYIADERFAAFYRKYHPEMPEFMNRAIQAHVARRTAR